METIGHASDRRFAAAMAAPAILVLLALNVYPIAVAVWSSFFRIHTITRESSWAGFGNYSAALADPIFWASLWRTLVWTVPSVLAQLVLGIAIALLLHQELKGRWLARGVVLFPYLVPAIVASVIWRFMFNPLTGVVNYVLVDVLHLRRQPIAWLSAPDTAMFAVILIGIWKFVPFMVILFLARLQTAPPSLEEAARIDGARPWQVFRHITLPWLSPTIVVALLFRLLWTFNHFDIVYLPARGGPLYGTTTLPVLIRTTAFDLNEMGKAAAISMLTVVLLAAAALVSLRYYQTAEDQLRT